MSLHQTGTSPSSAPLDKQGHHHCDSIRQGHHHRLLHQTNMDTIIVTPPDRDITIECSTRQTWTPSLSLHQTGTSPSCAPLDKHGHHHCYSTRQGHHHRVLHHTNRDSTITPLDRQTRTSLSLYHTGTLQLSVPMDRQIETSLSLQ